MSSPRSIDAPQRLSVFADYHQVMLRDRKARSSEPDLDWGQRIATDWIVQNVADPDVLVFGTERSDVVPLELVLLEHRPPEPVDLGPDEHVVEGSVAVASGVLVVRGLSDGAAQEWPCAVPPGGSRVRVHAHALGRAAPDGLDGPDSYTVTLWPDEPAAPSVIHRRG